MHHYFNRKAGYRIGAKRHCIIGVYVGPQGAGEPRFYIDDCGRELTKEQARG